MGLSSRKGLIAALGVSAAVVFTASATAQTMKVQASWPASATVYENLTQFAERIQRLTDGRVKVEAMPAGQIVPAFEVLDATHKKVIDGHHSWAGYWVGKNKAAILFSGGPGGPLGMDHMDYMGWLWFGGGMDLYHRFYRDVLKLNVVVFPMQPSAPQALGWFKKKISSLADLKGMKCRQTGIAAEIFNEMGMRTVNMPGGEIVPAADRGTIDCAEWVGGVEDLRFGFQTIWKYHYSPSLHEPVSVGELGVNGDVWKSLSPLDQEIFKATTTEVMFRWWANWQRQNGEAYVQFRDKDEVNLETTPPEVHKEFLAAWDRIVKREEERNPFFKEVWESQKRHAALTVPAKRFYYPVYSLAADHYWPSPKK